MNEVQEIARLIGIGSVDKFESREDLVRTIQLAMGFEDCYSESVPRACPKREKCMWQEHCVSFKEFLRQVSPAHSTRGGA